MKTTHKTGGCAGKDTDKLKANGTGSKAEGKAKGFGTHPRKLDETCPVKLLPSAPSPGNSLEPDHPARGRRVMPMASERNPGLDKLYLHQGLD